MRTVLEAWFRNGDDLEDGRAVVVQSLVDDVKVAARERHHPDISLSD